MSKRSFLLPSLESRAGERTEFWIVSVDGKTRPAVVREGGVRDFFGWNVEMACDGARRWGRKGMLCVDSRWSSPWWEKVKQ